MDSTSSTSQSFLDQLVSNDPKELDKGMGKLNTRYRPSIERSLKRQDHSLGADLDDLWQKVLLVVHRKLNRSPFVRQRKGSFRNWLKGIADNCLKEYQRSRRRRRQTHAGAVEVHGVTHQGKRRVTVEEVRDWIRELLKSPDTPFNARDWQIFIRFTDGASAPEIAAEMGVSLASVYAAKSRVTRWLRENRDKFFQ